MLSGLLGSGGAGDVGVPVDCWSVSLLDLSAGSIFFSSALPVLVEVPGTASSLKMHSIEHSLVGLSNLGAAAAALSADAAAGTSTISVRARFRSAASIAIFCCNCCVALTFWRIFRRFSCNLRRSSAWAKAVDGGGPADSAGATLMAASIFFLRSRSIASLRLGGGAGCDGLI